MVTTLPQNSLYLLGLLTGVITGLMTGVAALIEMLPGMKQNQEAYNWTVRAANGALCLLAVFGVQASQNQFDLHNWIAYLLTAALMAGGSHLLYVGTTARTRHKLNNSVEQVYQLHSMIQVAAPSNLAAQDERGQPTFVA